MEISEISQLLRNSSRFQEVLSVLAKYGLAGWLHATNIEWVRSLLNRTRVRDLGQLTHEQRVREAITELGTTFIKLGQVLSTRADLVGVAMADELAHLRTGTPADPPETVKRIVEEELGASVDELFAEFDGEALASASIGQVHRARLHDGVAVVVKVQHPGIEQRVRNDLDILNRLAELAELYSEELSQYRPVDTASDFRRTLMRELDFRGEQRNLDRFRRNFASDKNVVFPKPYAALCSTRVLTMDLLEGVNLSDSVALSNSGFDLEKLARQGAKLFIDMIFRDAFYHADPHPGNLMALGLEANNIEATPTGATPNHEAVIARVGVLDCGMVGRLDESLREDIERILLSVVNHDSQTTVEIIMRRGDTPDDLDVDELRLDVEDFLDEYANQSLDDFNLSGCLNGIIEIIRRHKIILPAKIAMLMKVLVMLEGTGQQLSPKFSLAELIEPYGRKSFQEKFSPQRLFRKVAARYRDWDALFDILPRDSADILHRLKKGSFDVHLNHRRLETTVNRLVLGIVTAALFMGSTSMLNHNIFPLWGVSAPGLIGCVTAVGLGAILIRAIRRSGNIEHV